MHAKMVTKTEIILNLMCTMDIHKFALPGQQFIGRQNCKKVQFWSLFQIQ